MDRQHLCSASLKACPQLGTSMACLTLCKPHSSSHCLHLLRQAQLASEVCKEGLQPVGH